MLVRFLDCSLLSYESLRQENKKNVLARKNKK